jgi:pimeloyl-ACP methyl ester carboxylesterase
MKKFLTILKKIFRWVIYIVLFLLVALLVFVEVFDRYLATRQGARWLYSNVPADSVEVKFTGSGVRYLSIGESDKPPLLLIHGAPGSLFDWKSFSTREVLYDKYRLLIPERPGYGGTRPRGAEPSIEVQARRLLEVLEGETQPSVVMGHSYGGPIALVMAALQPERIATVVGVAGQYDPDNEITFKISYFINYQIFKFLLPRAIWVSNVEKLTHPEELRKIVPYYREVEACVLLIHGDSDSLVPYENSPYLMKYLDGEAELITLEGKDHPLHMQEVDYLVNFVMEKVVY